MASVRSLGVHTPSALLYLAGESILEQDAPSKNYQWETYTYDYGHGQVEEELLWTTRRVVWSRGGVVQKSFDFEIEEQQVVQAVLTWLDSNGVSGASTTGEDESSKSSQSTNLHTRKFTRIEDKSVRRQSWSSNEVKSESTRALVVFLKFQAHLFFLDGSTHIINLPFEVEKAFPTPKGLLLQRKLPSTNIVTATPLLPSAPQNSFISANTYSQPSFRLSSSFGPAVSNAKVAKKAARGAANSRLLQDIFSSTSVPSNDSLPRLFSFTDPLSELGLVVQSSSPVGFDASQTSTTNSRRYEPIDRAEEVLYVSVEDEAAHVIELQHRPLMLVVTANHETRLFTIWNASYLTSTSFSGLSKRRASSVSVKKARRRSSYGQGPGTGATTPGIRPRDVLRESFGGHHKGTSVPPSKNTVNFTQSQNNPSKATDTFASQLDPDNDLTQQAPKESRRVSSMISRGDLSTNYDKSAFQDLATNASINPSFVGTQRRGPSFGAIGDRVSFGAPQRRQRASTPGSLSRLSLGDDTADYSNEDDTDTVVDDDLLGFDQPLQGLQKEVMMSQVAGIPFSGNAPIFKNSFSAIDRNTDAKVFVIPAPPTTSSSGELKYTISVHIVSPLCSGHTEITLHLQTRKTRFETTTRTINTDILHPISTATKTFNDTVDAIKLSCGSICRGLRLTTSISGGHVLSLSCQRQFHLPVEFPVTQLRLFNPDSITGTPPSVREAAGIKRTMSVPDRVRSLGSPSLDGCFDLIDKDGVRHRLQLELRAQDEIINNAFALIYTLLPEHHADLIMSTYWNILPNTEGSEQFDRQWTAFTATLFSLLIPYLEELEASEDIPSLRETANISAFVSPAARPTSPSGSWELMENLEFSASERGSITPSSWLWALQTGLSSAEPSPAKSRHSSFILSSIHAARQFNASSLGHLAQQKWSKISGRNSDSDARITYCARIVAALHLSREEDKLHKWSRRTSQPGTVLLTASLAQIGQWLSWPGWGFAKGAPYTNELGDVSAWQFDQSTIPSEVVPTAPWHSPPDFPSWMGEALSNPTTANLVSLRDTLKGKRIGTHSGNSYLAHGFLDLTRMESVSSFILTLLLKSANDLRQQVEALWLAHIDGQFLESLPESVVASMRNAIVSCQSTPPTTWTEPLLQLLGRDDLFSATVNELDWKHTTLPVPDSARDYHAICQLAEQAPGSHTSPEHDRGRITRLIFKEDRRYIEALKLLEPLKQTVAECIPDPGWTEAEYLDAQKGVMQWVMLRTFSLPLGNAMINYNIRRPLLTEKYPLHGFTTSCLMKPMNNIVTADRSSYTEEKFGWAFFHAGVFAGLTISKDAKGIDTSWVVFNKRAELSNKHAGLLFGLGLNGHLKHLAKWLSFKYLTPKHAMTTVGLLLGLAASFIGTMDTLVTRLLSVHVTRMLPPGAAELNLSPFTQTTGLMGIGLLYHNTQHRRMSEIMLSEIEHVELTDPSDPPDQLRDEGYRLSAGFALGFINLGRGNDLRGLHDMRILERLMAVAVGAKPVDIVHILDQATAGATIAIALIFMKTHNETVARKIDIPDTLPQFDYVRPDVFLLRTLAKHLIMWNDIKPEQSWIVQNLPSDYRADFSLREIKKLRSEHMPFYSIVAGLLWSIGLKYAGSGDLQVRDFLLKYLDQFMRICRLSAIRYDAKLARNTVRNCQDLVALAAATVMAGTGDLDIFRRLRALHGRVGSDVPYGSHLAAHFALGALFMAGGTYTFGTSNLAIASLVCAFYPLFPMDVLDNKAHLQAFRHFWVLAAEPRCIVVRDVDTHRAISLPIVLKLKDSSERELSSPCLIPELDSIASITTKSTEFWQVTLDFTNNPAHLEAFRKTQTIRVRRRPVQESHSSTFNATLTALNEAHVSQSHGAMLKWSWLFDLPALSEFEKADIGLILPSDSNSSIHTAMQGTVLDDRLALSEAARSWNRDDLLNIRLLLTWAERTVDQDGGLKWLGWDIIERLRAIILERANDMSK